MSWNAAPSLAPLVEQGQEEEEREERGRRRQQEGRAHALLRGLSCSGRNELVGLAVHAIAQPPAGPVPGQGHGPHHLADLG